MNVARLALRFTKWAKLTSSIFAALCLLVIAVSVFVPGIFFYGDFDVRIIIMIFGIVVFLLPYLGQCVLCFLRRKRMQREP